MKQAAVVLIKTDKGILGVSRKNNPKDIGLPGGKLNPNETLEQCAIRETLEETGLIVKLDFSKTPFIMKDDEFEVTAFLAKIVSGYIGEGISKTETGRIGFFTKEDILQGCFKEYNKKMF